MAVFSTRNDRSFVTKNTVKKSRVQGNHSKTVHSFMQSNTVQVSLDSSGKPIITTKERQHD